MLTIVNTEVAFLERAINAISNSFTVGEIDTTKPITDRKLKVAKSLGNNTDPHQSHDAYLKGIVVQFDIKYPQYWTPEFQRYHFMDIIMSQSTMHALDKMLDGEHDPYNKYVTKESKDIIRNLYEAYKKDPTYENFVTLRANLCGGFEMWETITTNYLQLKTIWIQRHQHKLKEDWGAFCNWIENLPRFKELCLDKIFKEEENKKKLDEVDPRKFDYFGELYPNDKLALQEYYIDLIKNKINFSQYNTLCSHITDKYDFINTKSEVDEV